MNDFAGSLPGDRGRRDGHEPCRNFRLCYLRGLAGIIVALAEQIG
jgi:hypothetical protein